MKKPKQVGLLLRLHKLETGDNGENKAEALQKLEKKLDSSLQKRYRRLKEKTGAGVAVVKDRMCSGCKMVYPETHDILRYANTVHTCEYCGRVLVVTEKSA